MSLQCPCKCIDLINNEGKTVDSAILPTKASGPCHLLSLTSNESPPFKRLVKDIKPQILTGTFLSDDELIELFTADKENGGRRNYLVCLTSTKVVLNTGKKLIEKEITANYELSERKFLTSLLLEAIDYGAGHNFDSGKLSCLLAIYVASHKYFKHYYWQSPSSIWEYFKQLMTCHTIEDFPDGQNIFSPHECFDVFEHFHKVYIKNLPLIHIVTFGSTKIKFVWPFTKN